MLGVEKPQFSAHRTKREYHRVAQDERVKPRIVPVGVLRVLALCHAIHKIHLSDDAAGMQFFGQVHAHARQLAAQIIQFGGVEVYRLAGVYQQWASEACCPGTIFNAFYPGHDQPRPGLAHANCPHGLFLRRRARLVSLCLGAVHTIYRNSYNLGLREAGFRRQFRDLRPRQISDPNRCRYFTHAPIVPRIALHDKGAIWASV